LSENLEFWRKSNNFDDTVKKVYEVLSSS